MAVIGKHARPHLRVEVSTNTLDIVDHGRTPGARRRFLMIHNPFAGRRWRALYHAVLDRLAAEGCSVDIREIMSRDDARQLARLGCGGDYDAVVIAGGDGTINEVANSLDHDAPPLGLIPTGTANVLAHELGLPFDAASLAEALLRGPDHDIYLGRANGRRFLMMASVGLDARVVAGLTRESKRRLGKGAYVLRGARELLGRRLPLYRIWIDGEASTAASIVVAKGRHYGGAFVCAPEASLHQPYFEVCVFTRPGRLNAIKYVVALMAGRHAALPDVRLVRARHVRVETPVGEPVQADGDVVTSTPLDLIIDPRPLRMIAPPPTP